MRLIAASTLFLIVAGSLEGMVSPIPWWPLSLKLIVSAMTFVLMVAYLRGELACPKPGKGSASERKTEADILGLTRKVATKVAAKHP